MASYVKLVTSSLSLSDEVSVLPKVWEPVPAPSGLWSTVSGAGGAWTPVPAAGGGWAPPES